MNDYHNNDTVMKYLTLFLVLISSIASAQVPPQFSSQPTVSTDYTCVGVVPCSTWPMPAMPSAGGSYIGNEGLPMLTTRYTSDQERSWLYTQFAFLGWDGDSVHDKPYKYGSKV
jgi:hypothetical protein